MTPRQDQPGTAAALTAELHRRAALRGPSAGTAAREAALPAPPARALPRRLTTPDLPRAATPGSAGSEEAQGGRGAGRPRGEAEEKPQPRAQIVLTRIYRQRSRHLGAREARRGAGARRRPGQSQTARPPGRGAGRSRAGSGLGSLGPALAAPGQRSRGLWRRCRLRSGRCAGPAAPAASGQPRARADGSCSCRLTVPPAGSWGKGGAPGFCIPSSLHPCK